MGDFLPFSKFEGEVVIVTTPTNAPTKHMIWTRPTSSFKNKYASIVEIKGLILNTILVKNSGRYLTTYTHAIY